jgi:hypothetical protein
MKKILFFFFIFGCQGEMDYLVSHSFSEDGNFLGQPSEHNLASVMNAGSQGRGSCFSIIQMKKTRVKFYADSSRSTALAEDDFSDPNHMVHQAVWLGFREDYENQRIGLSFLILLKEKKAYLLPAFLWFDVNDVVLLQQACLDAEIPHPWKQPSSNSSQNNRPQNNQSPSTQRNGDVMSDYDQDLANRVSEAVMARKSGRSLGLCFTYVANAMEAVGAWPRGFHDNGSCNSTDLNCRTFANSFSARWHTPSHSNRIPYKAVFLKNNMNGEQINSSINHTSLAPKGSILVWHKCSQFSSEAGHIAIVTEKGRTAVSDFLHGTSDVCNEDSLTGIFIPVKK